MGWFMQDLKDHGEETEGLHIVQKEDVAVAAAETPALALGEPMVIMTALQLVLRKPRAHEGAKVIEKHALQLCVLAQDFDQPDYVKLVKAPCADHNVSLITVPMKKLLANELVSILKGMPGSRLCLCCGEGL
nr:40S ribosomal protein S12-like isoform X2 [Nicotiana tomentosiformis]